MLSNILTDYRAEKNENENFSILQQLKNMNVSIDSVVIGVLGADSTSLCKKEINKRNWEERRVKTIQITVLIKTLKILKNAEVLKTLVVS